MRYLRATALALCLSASAAFAEQATPATPPAADDVAEIKKELAAFKASTERRLTEITKQLEAIAQFLGSDRASSFETVDRRLRDLSDDLDDIKRDLDRR